MLISRTPKTSDNNQILISLENQLQKEILEKEYNKLLFFLRKELQNDKITLETQIKEKGEETVKDKRLYTVEEKYQHLKQKNQLLDKLKKDLDLDFDY
jgi:chromosomal replication initiation ATPase DnaA